MLSATLISSDATLNKYCKISSFEFVGGEDLKMSFQLIDKSCESIRYVPPSTAIVTLTLFNSDGSMLDVIASFIDAGDRSLISVSLTQSQTESVLGGNILVSVDVLGDGTVIKKGVIQNALGRVDLSSGY